VARRRPKNAALPERGSDVILCLLFAVISTAAVGAAVGAFVGAFVCAFVGAFVGAFVSVWGESKAKKENLKDHPFLLNRHSCSPHATGGKFGRGPGYLLD